MAKQIKASEIFENEDIFRGVRESATETIAVLEKMQTEVKQTATELKSSIGTNKMDSSKTIKQFADDQSRANKLMMESIKIEELKQKALKATEITEQQRKKTMQETERVKQQSLRTDQQSEKLDQQSIKTDQQKIKLERDRLKLERDIQRENERKIKAQERADKAARNEASAYKQLERQTRELKNASKELAAQLIELERDGKKNTDQFRNLSTQYRETTRAAQQADQQLKKIDQSVGDNFRNVGNYTGAISKLQSGLGALGLAFGVGEIVRTGATAIMEFDQSIADLSAITGASGDNLEFFKKQANELGKDVEGGAVAVVEAYKLIGSAKPELLENASALNQVTKSAITLAQAAGMEVPEAATALTDAMNQFGVGADQADRFINVLAAGSKEGAVEIPQVTEALLKFGAVAKTSNVSIEETTALIETLGERGLKGAEAGTALRNVMLKLSAPDALPKEAVDRLTELGVNFDVLRDKSIPFTDRLRELQPLLNDAGALVKTFGTENAVAATNLISLTDRTDELTGKLTGTNSAYEQAETRTNTLGHALMELKNSFLSLFTSVGSGENSMQPFIDSIKWIAQNLPTIISVLWKVIRTWLIYKGTIQAIKAANWIAQGGFKQLATTIMEQIPLTEAYKRKQIEAANANKTFASGADTASKGAKGFGNAIKAIPIAFLISALVEIFNWWSNVASAAAQARKQQDMYNQAVQEGVDSAGAELTPILADYEEKKKDIMDKVRTGELTDKQAIEQAIKLNEKQIGSINKLWDEASAKYKEYNEEYEWLKDNARAVEEINRRDWYLKQLNKEATKTEEYQKAVKQLETDQKELNVQLKESAINAKNYDVNIQMSNASAKDFHATAVKIKTEFEQINDYIERTKELMQELNVIGQNRELNKMQDEIDGAIANAVKLVKETGQINVGVEANAETGDFGSQFDPIEQMIIDKYEKEKQFITQRTEFAVEQLQKQLDREMKLEKDKLIEERDELLKQDGITTADKEKIAANYKIRLNELDVEQKEKAADVEKEKQILREKSVDDQTKTEEEKNKKINEYNDKLLQGEKEFHDERTKEWKEDVAERIANEKELWSTINEYVKATTDFFIDQSQKRIDQIDKEIAMAEKQFDTYKSLAESGNILASQSLAEQQRIIAEKQREKEKLERRQQRLKLVESVFSTYNAKVQSGSKNALAETFRDATLLTQFIKTLPMFESGTIDTGKNGRGVDGRGGFHAILHPNERVVPKHLNEKIGGMSNEQLAKIAIEYQNLKTFGTGATAVDSPLNFMVLVDKIDQLNQTIKNKPETNIGIGEITRSAMEIVERKQKGNTITYNRYKIK
jgi:TP901 family phage tail tape measure protein